MHELLALTEDADAVLFDVDGTLYRQAPLRRRMALRLTTRHVLRPRIGRRTLAALSAYRAAQEEMRHERFVGDVATEQLERAARRSGVTAGEVAAAVETWMEASPLDALAACRQRDLVDLLDALRERGTLLAAVSDYPADRKLAALGVAHHFDTVVSAQDPDVGAFKPDPRGLLVAADRLGVDVADAIYVGDRVEVDGAAAAAAGMRAVILDVRGRPISGVTAG